MEKINRLVQESNQDFRTADHLIYINATMHGSNKLLLFIAKKLYLAGLNSIDAVLHYEKVERRISFLPSDFGSKIYIFESEVLPRMRVVPDILEVLKELNLILNEHKESPIEFSRGDKFVICNDGYSTIRTLDLETLKSYRNIIRNFLYISNGMVKNV